MLDVLAAIPDATVLTLHADQPTAAFTAFMILFDLITCRGHAVAGIVLELGNEG